MIKIQLENGKKIYCATVFIGNVRRLPFDKVDNWPDGKKIYCATVFIGYVRRLTKLTIGLMVISK
jgi:hypothetical protein